jgi:cell division protein FtsL
VLGCELQKKTKNKLFVIVFFLSIFIYVWQQNISTSLAYQISYLNKIYENAIAKNDNLKLKINNILSTDNMYKIAKEKKFVFPNKNSIVYIK